MQRFKTLLEIRQNELGLSIEHQLQYARSAEPEPDTVDQATNGYEKESLLQRSNKEQQLLRMIESALGRIRDGSFGQCLSCHNEIDTTQYGLGLTASSNGEMDIAKFEQRFAHDRKTGSSAWRKPSENRPSARTAAMMQKIGNAITHQAW